MDEEESAKNVDDLRSSKLSVKYECMKCGNDKWEICLVQITKVKDDTIIAFVESKLVAFCSECKHQRTFGKLGYMR